MLLVSGATRALARIHDQRLGRLLRPGNGNVPDELPWAADNGAYSGFDAAAFEGMLTRFRGKPGCLWVTAPDRVGDAVATMMMFEQWGQYIRKDFPVAFVAQDGQDIAPPWDELDCLFIGGTTHFKLGDRARRLGSEAKRRQKLVHMGRVNSSRRLRYAHNIGCDSVDGTGFSRFPDTLIPWALRQLDHIEKQPILSGFYS